MFRLKYSFKLPLLIHSHYLRKMKVLTYALLRQKK